MKKLLVSAVAFLATAILLTLGVSAVDFSVSPAATGEVLGDANGDGAVNAMDVLFVKRYAANVQLSVEVGADANCDGRINASDILAMKRHAAEVQNLSELSKERVKILAVNGVNVKNMAVVAPEGTDPSKDNAAYAADMLRRYMMRTTGGYWDVEFGTPSTEHAIYVQYDPTITGDGDLLDKTAGELGEEGFTIEVRDGNVYITGGRLRGCMYGVYEFLEEYVGVRFIANDEVYYYSADIINLKNGISDTQIPQFKYRHAGGDVRETSTVTGYALPRKINSRQLYAYDDRNLGYQVGNHFANAHSYAYYRDDMWPFLQGQDEEYDKKLSNYNSNWQPCFTSDEDFEELFRGLIRFSDMKFKEEKRVCIPGQSLFSFSIMDNTNYCQCASCRALYERIGVSGASIQFASRAADRYQDYYPGIKLYTILYDKNPPAEGLYVSENLVIMYCGTGCNNHIPGTGGCGDNTTVLGTSNKIDEESFPEWCKVCDEVYFWEYGVNYSYYMAPCPCVFNIYYDAKWVAENGGRGFYYENNDDSLITFEKLKSYIACRVMWDTDMTWEECQDIILEYLYIRYGDGYEDIYRLIWLLNECGDNAGCFINNHDRPWEMYDPETVAKYFEEMLTLVDSARNKADTDAKRTRIDEMALHVYFLGLSATYEDVYVNGSDEAKAEYAARYEWLYNYLKNNNIPIFSTGQYPLPAECVLNENPMVQFYTTGYSN